jgi:hypothetical protein
MGDGKRSIVHAVKGRRPSTMRMGYPCFRAQSAVAPTHGRTGGMQARRLRVPFVVGALRGAYPRIEASEASGSFKLTPRGSRLSLWHGCGCHSPGNGVRLPCWPLLGCDTGHRSERATDGIFTTCLVCVSPGAVSIAGASLPVI